MDGDGGVWAGLSSASGLKPNARLRMGRD
jgi:hypothetical protein